jgi:hypothetical protein
MSAVEAVAAQCLKDSTAMSQEDRQGLKHNHTNEMHNLEM